MSAPRTVRGIRDSLASGTVIGRASSGQGAAELISFADLAAALKATGQLPTGGSGTGLTQAQVLARIFFGG